MDGQLERVDAGRVRLRFTRPLAHPVEKVWRFITEPEHLRHWFPATIHGEFVVGAALRFAFGPDDDAPTSGRVLAVEPPKVLEFTWEDAPHVDVIRIELEPTGDDGCVLTFLDTIDEIGRAARDGTGWHVCLDALEQHLDGEPVDDDPEAWQRVHPRYVAAFGPEASAIGPPDAATR